ncbi:hypothetical protein DVA85_09750 [Acinetobacter sp. RIT592]|nr:hypothetical protein DVA85_09750 [Acinetobacter sp. RIT592]
MNTPIALVENLYSSYGADNVGYLICSQTKNSIYFIADGHSQRVGSAELVRLFIQYLNKNLNLVTITGHDIQSKINGYLFDFKESVKRILPRAAMCFVIVVKIDNFLHVFYLGDCRLGKFIKNNIEWITKPHSYVLQNKPNMTEEELRVSEYNHVIYKQFSTTKFLNPDYVKFDLTDSEYILATDGLWKLLPEKQALILSKKFAQLEDDVAFLRF